MNLIKFINYRFLMEYSILSLIVFVCFGCGPKSSPESDFKVNDTGETIIKYIGNDIDVVIPSEIYGTKITAIVYAFQNTNVINVTIPDGITTIGDAAFAGSKIRTINIPNSVIELGLLSFSNCKGLKEITLPNSVKTIKHGAFSNCENLNEITIPKNLESLEDFVFSDCTNLSSIEVDKENQNYVSVEGVLFDKNKTILIKYPSSKIATKYMLPASTLKINRYAFSGCVKLLSISLPEGLKDIGEYAFNHCDGLESITIPSTVDSIGDYAFIYCSSLKSVRIEPTNPPKIKDLIFDELLTDNLIIQVPKSSVNSYTNDWKYCRKYGFQFEGY